MTFQQQFTNGEIVAATGVTNVQLQNWLRRGQIIGSGVEGGGSPGKHRRFSFFNLMEIAVATALIETGLTDMARVTNAARTFAHTGSVEVGNRARRLPGLPYEDGHTWLIVGTERTEEYQLLREDGLGFAAAIGQHGFGAVVLNITKVFNQTLRRAGLDPIEVMRAAYME